MFKIYLYKTKKILKYILNVFFLRLNSCVPSILIVVVSLIFRVPMCILSIRRAPHLPAMKVKILIFGSNVTISRRCFPLRYLGIMSPFKVVHYKGSPMAQLFVRIRVVAASILLSSCVTA